MLLMQWGTSLSEGNTLRLMSAEGHERTSHVLIRHVRFGAGTRPREVADVRFATNDGGCGARNRLDLQLRGLLPMVIGSGGSVRGNPTSRLPTFASVISRRAAYVVQI
jgi:hypothetical protein